MYTLTASDIEKPLTVNEEDGQKVTEWMDVGNGCICCSVKYIYLTAYTKGKIPYAKYKQRLWRHGS